MDQRENELVSVYLSGPIRGQSYAGATGWRETLTGLLVPHGFIIYDPMRGKEYLARKKKITGSYEEHPLSSQRAIWMRDMWDVRRCDIMAVYLLEAGDVVSIGTMLEIGGAAIINKPMVGCWEDNTPHDHPMLREAISVRAKDLDELAELIIGLKGAQHEQTLDS